MRSLEIAVLWVCLLTSTAVSAAEPVKLKHSQAELEGIWKARIQSFLDQGRIPMIDLESSLKKKDVKRFVNKKTFAAMDKAGLALMALDGYQAKKGEGKKKGYRWGYYLNDVINKHPDHFILASNGGTNKNWLKEKDSFIRELVKQVKTGDYPIMGEFDFRHYMSGHQCKAGRTDRDNDIPLNGKNGKLLFQVSSDTGIAFIIHLEPEDEPIAALKEMLQKYPKAKVIWAHFAQVRHPEKQGQFSAANVRKWLSAYPNLYYDLSTGGPGRRYKCNDNVLDVALWQSSAGGQKGVLKPEFKALLTDFSDRFVVGLDYGGGRDPLPEFIKNKMKTRRLMIKDLPTEAQHNIAYRNAWKLLTGKAWQ